MNRTQRSAINAIVSMIGYVVPMALGFVAAPILISLLGEEAFGLQSLVSVVIGYAAMMDAGLDFPITKFLAEDQAAGATESQNRLMSTTLYLYTIIGLVGMVLLVFGAEWLSTAVFAVSPELQEQAIWVFRLAGLGVLGSLGVSWGRAVGMGLQRFEISYGVSTTVQTAGVVSGLVAVYLGFGIVSYVFCRVLWSFLGIFAYYFLARRVLPSFRLRKRIDLDVIRRVRSYIGYGALNRVIGSIGGRLDQTLIGILLGVAAAGIYALPFLLVSSLGYMLSYIVGFIFPMASELYSQGQVERLRTITTRTTLFLTALCCMTFFPLIIFGESFMQLWVGPAVAEQAALVLILLAISTLITTLLLALLNFINVGIGQVRAFTIWSFCRMVVIGGGCLLFLPSLGIAGAGVAFLISNIVDVIYAHISFHKYLAMSLSGLVRTAYWKPIALGLLLAVPALAVRPYSGGWINLIAFIGLYLLVYTGLAFRLGIFGETEKEALLGIWSSARAAFT